MEGFQINYTDIYDLFWEYKTNLENLMNKIDTCENCINFFIKNAVFTGETGDAVRSYLTDVHITMLSSIRVTAQNLLDNMTLYKAGYYDIDNSTNFKLSEEAIRAFRTKLSTNYSDTESYTGKIQGAVSGISDISGVGTPSTNGVLELHEQLDQELLNLITEVQNHESSTVTALENSVELLLSSLNTCIAKIGLNTAAIASYESNSFYTDKDVYALANISELFYQQHEDNKDVYDAICEAEQNLKDAAEERETQGVWKTVGGVVLVGVGVACIIATAGAASPIVAAVGVAVGTGTTIFGAADSAEGAQDIYYGSIGDIDSTAVNDLKDVVFQGNEEAYYLTESVFAFAASAMIPIGQAASAGNLTFRSGATIVAKEGIATAAGAGAQKYTTDLTGNQTAGMIAGMAASMATAKGLNGIEAGAKKLAKPKLGDVGADGGAVLNDADVGSAVKSGINSYADFSKAISDIGMRSDLTDAQKISELQKLFESSNYKADINVPSDIQYVKGFDAKGNVIYDWPPKLGFDESTIKSISRTDSLPDTWDRYGYMGGSNFADVPPTGKYTYSERAIPYVENEAAYHTGTFNNATYFDKIDAIKNGDIDGLNTILSKEGIANVDSSYFKNLQNTYNDFIEDTADAVGRNIDATYGLKGTAASWGDMSGGAGQYVTPLNGSTMKRLGIIN
ncbi:T7SS effector LXG polymorphic toxin [Roseburia sp. 831b]|uniref:T7SS effector LXG polymorphic toxin n=1 Tax=Roseburia sp. 831b TaxID=1261635 RepID=UPI0009528DCD|nr:T7SS effector LXG polymorphic toxin [Roseburia sp. 831b]WVK73168.1 T7SS effector LXG polymorphic toxin [Roseburia sp. 831b]